MYAIIGGTGVYDAFDACEEIRVETKFGIVELDRVEIDDKYVYFLSRHGKNHSAYPHTVNYRANMTALKQLGVNYVFATAAVGSMNKGYYPGDIVVIKDFIDFTNGRPLTVFDESDGVIHTEMSDPYCKMLRSLISSEIPKIKGEAIYVTTNGPRFETAAEIKMYSQFGDVVGMTNSPEVVFAKELGMHYAAVGIITNWCTGYSSEIEMHDISAALSGNKELVTSSFINIIRKGQMHAAGECNCENALIRL